MRRGFHLPVSTSFHLNYAGVPPAIPFPHLRRSSAFPRDSGLIIVTVPFSPVGHLPHFCSVHPPVPAPLPCLNGGRGMPWDAPGALLLLRRPSHCQFGPFLLPSQRMFPSSNTPLLAISHQPCFCLSGTRWDSSLTNVCFQREIAF